MTKEQLKNKLKDSHLFAVEEIEQIAKTVGQFELQFVPAACELLGIELTNHDIATLNH